MNLTNPQLLGNSFISTQISKTDDQSLEQNIKVAVDNGLTLVNLTDCIQKLKAYYNISKEENLVIVKSDASRSMNITKGINQSVSFDIYNGSTMEKLNKSICDDFQIKSVLKDSGVNQTLYNQLKKEGIDIYNPDDKVFTSRCFSNIDPTTGYSTTINFRIDKYFRNKTIQCGNGCYYVSVDDNNYVTCQCSGVTKTNNEFFNTIGDFVLNGFSNINIDVVKCYKHVFSVNLLNLILEFYN
jgi:hypothetical protein